VELYSDSSRGEREGERDLIMYRKKLDRRLLEAAAIYSANISRAHT